MPLIHTIQLTAGTKIGIWSISEPEEFFNTRVRIEQAIHHPHKRRQRLAARYLLTALCPDFPVSDIRIMESRKPYLEGDQYHFSLSHCGDLAAAIISSRSPVGVDVETVSAKVQRVMHKFLTVEEQQFIDPGHRLAHLTVCWSAKEAIYKWQGRKGVSFRENMRLQPFSVQPAGMISAQFIKEGEIILLNLQYLLYDTYCVVWVGGE